MNLHDVAESSPQLVRKRIAAELVGRTPAGLDKLHNQDPTFPKPIKFGSNRQSAAYYSLPEINVWIAQKLVKRGEA
jgi:prophage regulatory protein